KAGSMKKNTRQDAASKRKNISANVSVKSPTQKQSTSPTKQPSSSHKKSFPVAGIGASAGGLEAFTALLKHLATDTGMAFVVVQHLSSKSDGILPDLLA